MAPSSLPIEVYSLQVCNFGVGLLFLQLVQQFGLPAVYTSFGVVSLLSVAFAYSFIIETKGHSLEEIQMLLNPEMLKWTEVGCWWLVAVHFELQWFNYTYVSHYQQYWFLPAFISKYSRLIQSRPGLGTLLIFLAIDVSTLNLREFRWLIALKKTLGSLKLEMLFGLKPSYALNNA